MADFHAIRGRAPESLVATQPAEPGDGYTQAVPITEQERASLFAAIDGAMDTVERWMREAPNHAEGTLIVSAEELIGLWYRLGMGGLELRELPGVTAPFNTVAQWLVDACKVDGNTRLVSADELIDLLQLLGLGISADERVNLLQAFAGGID